VQRTTTSAPASDPSAKRTLRSPSAAMFGFGTISPCAMRDRMSSETVGCAEPNGWSGAGSP
jgi:hypothetical protein